ncbi:MAG: recombination protein O N-terminal domain-containing protein [Bacteroidaceae bacterium]|nr:recombination protein O N-terminal domain-containing protein [Bacteroidaceae bacterium]
MFVTSRAIVLNKVRHNDNTVIATLYTEAQGSVAFAVKRNGGGKRTNSSNLRVQLLQPLTLLTVEWEHHPTRQLQQLKNIEAPTLSPLRDFAISDNLIAEALYHALKEEHQGDHFPFLQHSLANQGDNLPIVLLIQLARHLGIAPEAKAFKERCFFDLLNAEYTDNPPLHKYYLHPYDAQHIPLILRLRYPTMHLLKLTPAERHRALRIILTFYRLHIPGFPQLRSLEMLRDML